MNVDSTDQLQSFSINVIPIMLRTEKIIRKNQLVEQEFLLEQENLILSRMVYCQSTVFEIDDCTLGIRVADHFKIILNILAMDRLLSVQGLFRIMFLIV